MIVPLATSLFPLILIISHCSAASLLTLQVKHVLWAFTLTVPSVWNALPSVICKAPPFRSGPQLPFQRSLL